MWHIYDSDTTGPHENIPRVIAELMPGRWPGKWWWEVAYIREGDDGWTHHWKWDGGAWLLHRAVTRAQEAADDLWTRLMMDYDGDMDITDPKYTLVQVMDEVNPGWDSHAEARIFTREELENLPDLPE